jgi:hypothetical protein
MWRFVIGLAVPDVSKEPITFNLKGEVDKKESIFHPVRQRPSITPLWKNKTFKLNLVRVKEVTPLVQYFCGSPSTACATGQYRESYDTVDIPT